MVFVISSWYASMKMIDVDARNDSATQDIEQQSQVLSGQGESSNNGSRTT